MGAVRRAGRELVMAAKKDADSAVESTKEQIQKAKDVEEDQGFHGAKVDPTPNEHYTVDGVLAGKPTPETDPEHAAQVRAEIGVR